MSELYRGLYLGPIDAQGSSNLKSGDATRVLSELLYYPLRNHWTPEKHVAEAFALVWRGGPNLAWRERERLRGPLLGLILIIDSETISDELVAEAVAAGLAAAEKALAKSNGRYDFFNEKERPLAGPSDELGSRPTTEGDEHYPLGRCPVLEQAGQPANQGPGLAGASTSDDTKRAAIMINSSQLLRV
jgi:hypothetical protein